MNPHDICQKSDIKGYSDLEDLALNLSSSWNHSTDTIWRKMNSELWELTQNPWAVLQTVSREKFSTLFADQNFCSLVKRLVQDRTEALNATSWFEENHSKGALKKIAYFSMEFMLSEALPIYSGGLGNVAGDQLKAASDLGVPVIGIGLLYAQGYFRQFIDKNGEQQELFPYNDPGQLPIRPLRLKNGEWLRLKIDLPGWSLWLRTWVAKVGRRSLYLLDSNDIANFAAHRGITSELYGGDQELRLKQELILGIGGWRLLKALGIEPEVCHMNEGHAAFVIIERAFAFMQKTNQTFEVALAATRIGNIFTTHTAVPAGFDRFPRDLIEKYLGQYVSSHLKISFEKFLSFGQLDPGDEFNMAYLAIRGCGFVNGVSQLHGEVSRHLFRNLFSRFPEKEVPIAFITNGVHMPTWDSPASDALWTESCGKDRWLDKTEDLINKIRSIPDTKIWQMRNESRTLFVNYARERLLRQLAARGIPCEEIDKAKSYLNPNALTIGFARRFAAYKRPDLLLYDKDRFLRILKNPDRPVQFVIAGKAHPKDAEGHNLIKEWMQFIESPEVRPHIVFLSDYDMILTEALVQGVDLWINTPRRPWEACGTSGMKILVNGGLNLSELDGWWAEAYAPEVGWAIGDRQEHGLDRSLDRKEANTLYDLLENEIIPAFYTWDERMMPLSWIGKIRESMARLTPKYSSNRTVREYTERFYLPAADNYLKRSENKGALAKEIADWQTLIEQNWNKLAFGELKIENNQFEVQVYLNDLKTKDIKVELYSEVAAIEMKEQGTIPNSEKGVLYRATIPQDQPVSNFTVRIVPQFLGVSIPLELVRILWQR